MLPTTVWLLRHAESAAPTVFHGAESDIELSKFGARQAAATVEWFREKQPTVVMSSAMRRAVATATPIAIACGVRHEVEVGLHERVVGALCGTASNPDVGPWADTVAQWSSGNTAFTTPGAESFNDLVFRLIPAWNRAIDAHRGGRIVLVAHGIVCKVLLLTLLPGWGPRRWVELGRVPNLATSELVQVGDTWHAEFRLVVPPPVAALVRPDAAT